jgi:uncharacterized protein DUF5946
LSGHRIPILYFDVPPAPDDDTYDALCCYTLEHGDPSFLHQHVVDAYIAQHANAQTKPIALTFALVGLYLHLEARFSGKQVQRAHMALAREKRAWPTFVLPRERGQVTVADVMAAEAGAERDAAIDRWCSAVWAAFHGSRSAVVELLRQYGIVRV